MQTEEVPYHLQLPIGGYAEERWAYLSDSLTKLLPNSYCRRMSGSALEVQIVPHLGIP